MRCLHVLVAVTCGARALSPVLSTEVSQYVGKPYVTLLNFEDCHTVTNQTATSSSLLSTDVFSCLHTGSQVKSRVRARPKHLRLRSC